MAEQQTAKPDFIGPLDAKTDDERLKVLKLVNPDYAERAYTWRVLIDAFEGAGGFLDGSYLWPYPREDDESYRKRCAMARYHNYVEALVDLYVRFMFTQGVKRESKSKDYDEWTQDVDGVGTTLDTLLKQLSSLALAAGHAGTLIDKTREEAAGQTKADEKARPIATLFAATDIPDWRFGAQNELTAIKLIEAAPQPSIVEEQSVGAAASQFLLWGKDGWARYDASGQFLDAAIVPLGLVPFVILRPKPSHESRMLGRPLVGNANIVRALFNRHAEEDQVLREQAFSVMTVEVQPEGDVDQTRAALGSVVGTAKALIAKGHIDYATPDQEVPNTIRQNSSYLVQEMYRAAHVRWSRDTLAPESGQSIRLQFTELNEMLQGFSKALAQAEKEIARAYFAWTTPTAEAAQAAFEKANPTATYPDEFFLDDLMTDLQAMAEALSLDLGETMTKTIKRRAVRRIAPDLPKDVLAKIDKEIEAQPTAEELMQQQPPPTDSGNPQRDIAAETRRANAA